MKKIFVVLLVLVTVLVVCKYFIGPIVGLDAPLNAVTMDEMFANTDQTLNDFKVTAWHRNYLSVEFNGKEYSLVDQSFKSLVDRKYHSTSIVTKIWDPMEDDWNRDNEYPQDSLLSRDFWVGEPCTDVDSVSCSKIGVEFVAINDRRGGSQEMVIIEKSKMSNLVDPQKWTGTNSTLIASDYPRHQRYLVRNISTNEIAIFSNSIVIDKDDNVFWWVDGYGPTWGNVGVYDEYLSPISSIPLQSFGGDPILVLRETKQ